MTKITEPGRITEPFRLAPTFSPRVWGRTDLSPWYNSSDLAEKIGSEKIGEAWLSGPQSVLETGELAGKTLAEVAADLTGGSEFPLLIKILFPSEKLSVQVHPDDDQAQASGHPRGKTECWYVLDAEPEASVACGLVDGTTLEDVERAIADGSLEDLLLQVPVKAGDMVFVDAGTVHAIGPGVTLLEVQQTSDITYRLYDYGRPRELHLAAGLAVVKHATQAGLVQPQQKDDFTRLIEAQYFIVDRYEIASGTSVSLNNPSAGCVVALSGSGWAGGVEVKPGQAVALPQGVTPIRSEGPLTFVWCWTPAQKDQNREK